MWRNKLRRHLHVIHHIISKWVRNLNTRRRCSGKVSPANAGDTRDSGAIPGSGRCPGEGDGNPRPFPCLETPTDRGARPRGHKESDTTEQLSTSMRDGNRGENSCDGGQNTRGTRHTRGEATAPTPRLRALQNMKTEVEMKRQATRRGKHLQIRLIRDFRKHSECQQLSNKSTINPIKKQVKDLKCQ